MRIWHEELIPYLCRQHLIAMWREGLGCFNIVTSDKQGYRNHPATKEFIRHQRYLWWVLKKTREEMLRRGYNPKELPPMPENTARYEENYTPWQTLEEQVSIICGKGCDCDTVAMMELSTDIPCKAH